MDRLIFILGGRCAELEFFGKVIFEILRYYIFVKINEFILIINKLY
jgi:hypothetical protein